MYCTYLHCTALYVVHLLCTNDVYTTYMGVHWLYNVHCTVYNVHPCMHMLHKKYRSNIFDRIYNTFFQINYLLKNQHTFDSIYIYVQLTIGT